MSAATYPAGAAPAAPAPRYRAARERSFGTPLAIGLVTAYLSLVVLIPLAAVVVRSTAEGWAGFWRSVTTPQALAALGLSLGASLVVVAVNAVVVIWGHFAPGVAWDGSVAYVEGPQLAGWLRGRPVDLHDPAKRSRVETW